MTKTSLENLAAAWAANRGQAAPKSNTLVYSTDKTLAKKADEPASAPSTPATSSAVRIRKETKGRGGKAVTVISGLIMPATELQRIAKELKALCGSGGTVKDSTIEVQGDHVDRLLAELQKRGYQVKKVGG